VFTIESAEGADALSVFVEGDVRKECGMRATKGAIVSITEILLVLVAVLPFTSVAEYRT
jgi:hypothetical protein